MTIQIGSAQVFDPALSGDETQYTRLEVRILHTPSPTHHETLVDPEDGSEYDVTHHSWLQDIVSDDPAWRDGEHPEEGASLFNDIFASDTREAVYPVTVWFEDSNDLWRVFYVKRSRVQKIMRQHVAGDYELVPSPAFVEHNSLGYHIADRQRRCVRCVSDAIDNANGSKVDDIIGAVPMMCDRYKVNRYREITLCDHHGREFTEGAAIKRNPALLR